MSLRLEDLLERYGRRADASESSERTIRDLYVRHARQREQTVLDAVAATAGLGGILHQLSHAPTELDPQLEEAFSLAFPDRTTEVLHGASTEELQGYASAWKGKYFEVVVRDRLQAGEAVGDLQLRTGQEAMLADSPSQPGWDLQIVDEHGESVVDGGGRCCHRRGSRRLRCRRGRGRGLQRRWRCFRSVWRGRTRS